MHESGGVQPLFFAFDANIKITLRESHSMLMGGKNF